MNIFSVISNILKNAAIESIQLYKNNKIICSICMLFCIYIITCCFIPSVFTYTLNVLYHLAYLLFIYVILFVAVLCLISGFMYLALNIIKLDIDCKYENLSICLVVLFLIIAVIFSILAVKALMIIFGMW